MNSKYFHIALLLWIFAAVSIGFAEILPETYSNRPTAYGLDGIVELGTDCSLGVSERCFATQYSTNPTQYRVEPFTNTAGFYLDQSLMGTMASKAKSLVQYYANPATVYNGTTNISMFTVPGLFTELDIGNHADKFTQTFASGTNAAVYGDSPWRICQENLDERHKVLNALDTTILAPLVLHYKTGQSNGKSVWSECLSEAEARYFASTNNAPYDALIEAHYGASHYSTYTLTISRTITGAVHLVFSSDLVSCLDTVESYLGYAMDLSRYGPNAVFDNNGITALTSNQQWNIVHTQSSPFNTDDEVVFINDNSLPAVCADPATLPGNFSTRGFIMDETPKNIGRWKFQYCTDE